MCYRANKLYSYSHVSPTPTAARALCGSSAISWIELVRSTLLALASPANFLASCPSAIRDRLRYDSVLQRCFHVKNVSPLRKFVSRSRAKMDQALPPLFVRAGQRSYVDYCAEGGRSLGTRLGYWTHLGSCTGRMLEFPDFLPRGCACAERGKASVIKKI